MYVIVREGNLMIEVDDHDGREAYTLKAWVHPNPDVMLVDSAPWGTTPLMDRLHVALVQLIEGIRPQFPNANVPAPIDTGYET